MTAPASSAVSRAFGALLLAVCFGLAALPGCGGSAPKAEKKDDKKDDKKDPSGAGPGTPAPNPGGTSPDVPPKTTLGAVEKAADDAATAFRRDLIQGTAKAEQLSSSFLKAVGKPAVLPSDKAKGFSPDSAISWLKKVGETVNFGPELQREQAGDVAYLRGALQKPGSYCLRLVKEAGAWKIDWLSISSVEGTVPPIPTPEGAAQGFAVAAFVETLADKDGMPKDERGVLLGSAMTPALRAGWAAPFGQDTAAGLDFNPGQLITHATKIGGGTKTFAASRAGDLPEFKVELTKPDGKKTYVVKLVKGTAAHEWLVSEVTETKG